MTLILGILTYLVYVALFLFLGLGNRQGDWHYLYEGVLLVSATATLLWLRGRRGVGPILLYFLVFLQAVPIALIYGVVLAHKEITLGEVSGPYIFMFAVFVALPNLVIFGMAYVVARLLARRSRARA
jgi:hypothetical protein